MQRLLEVMHQLRAPGGCPWDQQQTHESLRPYLLEEAAEAVDALTSGDPAEMTEELGDVLLQVAFHAVIAEEAGRFSYGDVEQGVVDKLVRRHPHVFGEVRVSGAEEVVSNWQAIKAREKGAQASPAERVPRSLPALMRAAELGRKLGWRAGSRVQVSDLARGGAGGDVEGDAREDVGALLLAVVDYARAQGVDPELALRAAADARAAQESFSDDATCAKDAPTDTPRDPHV